jgi:hypothetical protein
MRNNLTGNLAQRREQSRQGAFPVCLHGEVQNPDHARLWCDGSRLEAPACYISADIGRNIQHWDFDSGSWRHSRGEPDGRYYADLDEAQAALPRAQQELEAAQVLAVLGEE